MNTWTRTVALAAMVVGLGGLSATEANAHIVKTKQARTLVKKEARALYREFRRDGDDITGYGIDTCERLSGHIISCTAYFEFTTSMCTVDYVVGYTAHRQRRPVISYMDDSVECFRV